jgi:hypothetical protein
MFLSRGPDGIPVSGAAGEAGAGAGFKRPKLDSICCCLEVEFNLPWSGSTDLDDGGVGWNADRSFVTRSFDRSDGLSLRGPAGGGRTSSARLREEL